MQEISTKNVKISILGTGSNSTVVATATSHSIDKSAEFVDATCYGMEDKRSLPVFKSVSGTLEMFEVMDFMFWDILEDGTPVKLEIDYNGKIETYSVVLEGVSTATSVGDLVKESISFTGTTPIP